MAVHLANLLGNIGGWLGHAAGSTLPGIDFARARARRRNRRWRTAPPHARRRAAAGGAIRSNARHWNPGANGRHLRDHLAQSRHRAPGVGRWRATRLGCAHGARSAERTNTIAAPAGGALRHLALATTHDTVSWVVVGSSWWRASWKHGWVCGTTAIGTALRLTRPRGAKPANRCRPDCNANAGGDTRWRTAPPHASGDEWLRFMGRGRRELVEDSPGWIPPATESSRRTRIPRTMGP